MFQQCEAGEFLATDFINDYWECLPIGGVSKTHDIFDFFDIGRSTTSCPVETGYHVCPGDGDYPTPIPPNEVTENPLGTCRCNGELWVAEGCAYGFYCDDSKPIGGTYLYCDEVHYSTLDWLC